MKRIAFLFLLTCSVFTNNIKAQIIHCIWENAPVSIDGVPKEWPDIFNYYDGNTKLQFAFASDTGSVYICLKITDDATQARLFNGGLGIWIDPKGKHKETMGVSFPLKRDRAPGTGEGGKHRKQTAEIEEQDQRSQRSDALRLKQHAFLTQTTLRIKGFLNVPEQELPLKNNFGINVGFSWDSINILTIEYKFPLALVLGHPFTAADTLKPISFAFVEAAIETPKLVNNDEDNSITGPSNGQSSMMNRGMSGGGMNNSMGGMGNRGMGGGGGGSHGSMQAINPANAEQKLWSKVVLALE